MKITRREIFLSHKNHLMLGKTFSKLSELEIELCLDFIERHKSVDNGEFGHFVNRWFLDQVNKPKHWVDMWALVMQSIEPKPRRFICRDL
jgi:hypothetical protein